MTIASYSAKNSVFTIFGARSGAQDSSLTARKSRQKRRASRYSSLFLVLIFLSLGTLFLAIHSVMLSFQTYKLQQLNRKIAIENEELRVITIERTEPDILAAEASVLQLSQRGNVRYLVLEPPTLAGSFAEKLP